MRDRCDFCGGDLGAKVDDDAPMVFCSHGCYDAFVVEEKAQRSLDERKERL